jgi:hypothetical protein
MARLKVIFFLHERKSASAFALNEERVFDVLDSDVISTKNDPDHVESKGVAGLLKARHPDLCGTAQLALLAPIDGADWATEIGGGAGFHFYECHRAGVALGLRRHEVDVAVAVPESALGDLPPVDG